MYVALSYSCMRTKLVVSEALSFSCMRPCATSVGGLQLLAYEALLVYAGLKLLVYEALSY